MADKTGYLEEEEEVMDEEVMDDEDDPEFDLEAEDTLCLFCEAIQPGPDAMWRHCQELHNFSFLSLLKLGPLDCFSYIKFINYMRKEKPSVTDLKISIDNGSVVWDSDEYLKPIIPDDPSLMYDVEESVGKMHTETDNNLQQQLLASQAEVQQLQEKLQNSLQDLDKLRQVAQDLLMASTPDNKAGTSSSNISADEDHVYFGSYSHFAIHQEMLQDKVRTITYKKSIEENAAMFRDKVVLDVGCGTGILSMFAAKAGAKLVIGVDMSDIIYQAMDIVRENGFEERIKLVKGKVEEIDLPVDQVDIIISEWMGYFLLFESMLDTILCARDKWLAPGGHVLPNSSSIWLQGLADNELHEKQVTFWNDVYGFTMTSMKSAVLQEASIQTVKSEKLVTDPVCIKDLDLVKCSITDLDFTSPFSLQCYQTCKLTALVAYFLAEFNSMQTPIQLSTSPKDPSTHWKQTVFVLEEPVHLTSGETLEGQLTCKKNPKDPRSLKITISFRGKTFKYVME